MTKIERLFPIFGIIFAAAYAYVLYHDMPLVTYHPILGEWDMDSGLAQGSGDVLVRARAHGVRRGGAAHRLVRADPREDHEQDIHRAW